MQCTDRNTVGLSEHHRVLDAPWHCEPDYAQLSARRFPGILNRTRDHWVLGVSRVGGRRRRASEKKAREKSRVKGKRERQKKKDSNNGGARRICQLANASAFTDAEPTVKRSSIGPQCSRVPTRGVLLNAVPWDHSAVGDCRGTTVYRVFLN